MKLGTLNVNGLRSAIKKGFLEWVAKEDFDVLCLQEVRMSEAEVEAVVPEGYHNLHAEAQKPGYSGVAIWSKVRPTSTQIEFDFPLADTEGRIVKAQFSDCIVYSMYFPSGTSGDARQEEKYRFLDFIKSNAASFLKQHNNVVICGDVNIAHTELDIFHHKTNANKSGFLPQERKWLTEFLDSGWVDIFRSQHRGEEVYSWWTTRSATARSNNIGWRIDYHLASQQMATKLQKSWIVDREVRLSDHTAVVAEYDIALG